MVQQPNPVMKHVIESALDTPKPPSKLEATEELAEAIGSAHDVLVTARTVFPFTLFPDTLTLDRTKLTITRRDIFRAGEAISVQIDDILNLTTSVDLFFGSISIATRFFDPGKPYTVRFFHRRDALKVKRIVQGYLIARQRNIDCSTIATPELAKMLDELGKAAPEDRV